MHFVKPVSNQEFFITTKPEWPDIEFETNLSGQHTWQWTLAWKSFTKSGTAITTGNKWSTKNDILDKGGKLTVTAKANNELAVITVVIKGTNPTVSEIVGYIASTLSGDGFDKIIQHETNFKHFNIQREPVKSFDNGYGMCQLTNPIPSFEQIWNWKLNIDAGLTLFKQKRAAAISYLGQSGRSYTAEQLRYESVSRWNGGSYHDWNAQSGKWQRKTNILCDTQTSNIGWDINDSENAGKTEAILHQRDGGSYASPPPSGSHWKYFGVCYADSILN